MFAKIYAIGSCVIGSLLIIESIIELTFSRKYELWNILTAIVETIWILVALFSICFLADNKKHLISPITYVLFNLLGFVVSITMYALDAHSKSEDIPLGTVITSLLFGVYYLIANIQLYKELKGSN